jgi:hypothetical protein
VASAKKKTPSFFHPQSSVAQRAFAAREQELEAFTSGTVQRVLVDVQIAAAVAHSVAQRDQEPERLAMFERLASADLYDLALPQRVAEFALATWFTRQRQLGRLALTSSASVPPEVLRNAQLQRRRMLKVLDHWFEDDPTIVAEVAVIRAGAGYQDLANDLEQLADLYQRPTIQAVIKDDHKHYEKSDVDDARKLARSIFDGLGLGRKTDAKRWGVLCQRAWTLLLQDYEEHRSAGAFLFRKLEDVAESFPSLVSAARRSPSPRPVSSDEIDDMDEVDEEESPVADELPEAVAR